MMVKSVRHGRLFQQRNAGGETNTGEEDVHEEALLHRIQFDWPNAGLMQGRLTKANKDTADYRV